MGNVILLTIKWKIEGKRTCQKGKKKKNKGEYWHNIKDPAWEKWANDRHILDIWKIHYNLWTMICDCQQGREKTKNITKSGGRRDERKPEHHETHHYVLLCIYIIKLKKKDIINQWPKFLFMSKKNEWKVLILNSFAAAFPAIAPILSRISAAAAVVNVIAIMLAGPIPWHYWRMHAKRGPREKQSSAKRVSYTKWLIREYIGHDCNKH